MKTLFVSNIPVNYRSDLYNRIVSDGMINPKFIFIPEKNVFYKDGIWANVDELFFKYTKVIQKSNLLLLFIYLKKEFYKNKFKNVIIVGYPKYFFIFILLKILFGYKIFTWWAGTKESHESDSKSKLYYRKICALFVSGVVFYSTFSEEYYLNIIRSINKRLVLGNNTRDSKRFLSKVRQQTFLETPKFKILIIGYATKVKNTKFVLNSFIKLNENIKSNLLINIVGDGPEIENLKLIAKSNSINAVFNGHKNYDEILYFYRNADIFIQPSLVDRWPQTYNEALASGVCSMVSNKCGIDDEYVRKYFKDVVFDVNDEKQFLEKFMKLYNNIELREKIKKDAIEIAINSDATVLSKNLAKFLIT